MWYHSRIERQFWAEPQAASRQAAPYRLNVNACLDVFSALDTYTYVFPYVTYFGLQRRRTAHRSGRVPRDHVYVRTSTDAWPFVQ